MKITQTHLKGCFIIEPTLFKDQRGSFFESYNKKELESAMGRPVHFVQDNHSVSRKGVLRGLHFQKGEYAQAKMVRVVKGEVLDVVVDVRLKSPTFGEHFKLKLSDENHKMLFIPKGMAHGFLSLKEGTVFAYKCDEAYHMAAEGGIIFNDTDLNIDWEFPEKEMILSSKDMQLGAFKSLSV